MKAYFCTSKCEMAAANEVLGKISKKSLEPGVMGSHSIIPLIPIVYVALSFGGLEEGEDVLTYVFFGGDVFAAEGGGAENLSDALH